MAWIEYRAGKNKGSWRISFRFGERRFNRSLKTNNKQEAEARQARLEEKIRFVESGRLLIPSDADVAAFLLSDGKLTNKIPPQKSPSLSDLLTDFFASLPEQSLEESTLYGMKIHQRHLKRLIGEKFIAKHLTLDDLLTGQRYRF